MDVIFELNDDTKRNWNKINKTLCTYLGGKLGMAVSRSIEFRKDVSANFYKLPDLNSSHDQVQKQWMFMAKNPSDGLFKYHESMGKCFAIIIGQCGPHLML